nr:hypothetical protein BaRGS_034405 [Batillaria attramentaria]
MVNVSLPDPKPDRDPHTDPDPYADPDLYRDAELYPDPASTTSTDMGESWSMLEAHNLTLDDLLVSEGLGSTSRWFDPVTELCIVIAFCVTIFLGLLGNVLVAVTLCRNGNLRSARHWYVMNLVVSDILTCVLSVPFTLVRLTLKDWPLGEALCRTAPTLQLTYVFVSILTILAIAVERYRAIVCSTRLKSDRQRVTRFVIPAIWIFSLGMATPLAVTHKLEQVQGPFGDVILTLCVEHWESDLLLGVYTVYILLFQYALPAATITALHLLICRFLRTRVHLRSDSTNSRQKLVRHRKNLALLTAISITFDVQWLPITVVNIIADFNYTVFASARHFCLTYALCLLFALSSVFINPVVYGWLNSNFRRGLMPRGSVRMRRRASEYSYGTSTCRRNSTEVTSRFSVIAAMAVGLARHKRQSGDATGPESAVL